MSEGILQDISLCAIVRDEKMNPAGGIRRFVEMHVPYVEVAVIVDTGSKDGTREILEELQGQYPNLEVYDREFDGYSNSRNYSLGLLETRKALILDADERLTRQDFQELGAKLKAIDKEGYVFDFLNVYPSGGVRLGSEGHNPRLFSVNLPRTRYQGRAEVLHFDDKPFMQHTDKIEKIGISIKHFLPEAKARGNKQHDWYNRDFVVPWKRPDAPSDCSTFRQWKVYNPHEINYV